MAKVFISHVAQDAALVGDLVRKFEAVGFQYHPDIHTADIVVVLWTPRSLAARFVIAEARAALEAGKLVQVATSEVETEQLVPPFSSGVLLRLDDTVAICAALSSLVARPEAAWGQPSVSDLEEFIRQYPGSPHAQEARELLAQIGRRRRPEPAVIERYPQQHQQQQQQQQQQIEPSQRDREPAATLPADAGPVSRPSPPPAPAPAVAAAAPPASTPAPVAEAAPPVPPQPPMAQPAPISAAALPVATGEDDDNDAAYDEDDDDRSRIAGWDDSGEAGRLLARRGRIAAPGVMSLELAGPAPADRQRRERVLKLFAGGGGYRTVTADVVDCSVFAPPSAPRREPVLVQVFIHKPEQRERAAALSLTMDASAGLRGVASLQAAVWPGSMVQIELDGRGLQVDEPMQSVRWMSEPTVATFSTVFPADAAAAVFNPVVRISADGKPLGRITFRLAVDETAQATPPEPAGTSARRYAHAFLSYAHQDRGEVLKRAQMLAAQGIAFFQDLLSLKPGERYTDKILGRIDQSDLFVLFWSRHAAKSEWVRREIARAEARQREHPEGLPDISAIVLDTPDIAPPPDSISHLHLNDPVAYLIAAHEPWWRRAWRAVTGR